jgi:membrane protease YdiL (CAAX protease family)
VHPELPDGVTPAAGAPSWRPWWAFVGLVLAFTLAVVGYAVIAGVGAATGANLDNEPPAISILATIFQDLCLIGVAVGFAWTAGRPQPWMFGLRPTDGRWKAVGYTAAAYFGFLALTALWSLALGLDEQDDLPDELGADESTVAMLAVAFLVTVVAPLTEELFFRGFFFRALRSWRGFWPAALLTGLTFGAIHAGSAPVGYLVPLAFFGIVLCALYQVTKSLYPCIVLHCLNNCVAFGVSMSWGWQIPVLIVASLGLIGLLLSAITRRAGPAPLPSPV